MQSGGGRGRSPEQSSQLEEWLQFSGLCCPQACKCGNTSTSGSTHHLLTEAAASCDLRQTQRLLLRASLRASQKGGQPSSLAAAQNPGIWSSQHGRPQLIYLKCKTSQGSRYLHVQLKPQNTLQGLCKFLSLTLSNNQN